MLKVLARMSWQAPLCLLLLLLSTAAIGAEEARRSATPVTYYEKFPVQNFGRLKLNSTPKIEQFLKRPEFKSLAGLQHTESLRKRALAIGRLEILKAKYMATCTAFLISRNYIMTNHHCVVGAKRFIFRAGYSFIGAPDDARGYEIEPQPVEMNADLDYAILKVKPARSPYDYTGALSISLDPLAPNTPLLLIGHPAGMPQMLSDTKRCYVQNTAAKYINRSDGSKVLGVFYGCPSIGGNSGSPVLHRDTGNVAILNHSGSKGEGGGNFGAGTPIGLIVQKSAILKQIVEGQKAEQEGCFLFNGAKVCGGSRAMPHPEAIPAKFLLVETPIKMSVCQGRTCLSPTVHQLKYSFRLDGDGSIYWVEEKQVFHSKQSTIKFSTFRGGHEASVDWVGDTLNFKQRIVPEGEKHGVVMGFRLLLSDGGCIIKHIDNPQLRLVRVKIKHLEPTYCAQI